MAVYSIKKPIDRVQYDSAGSFSEQLAGVELNGSSGYIDHNGACVIRPQFDRAAHFSEGLAAVQVGQKWGYVSPGG
jgi:hypothetical protein